MNISSLPIQSKKRLSELLEDLTDILNRKDSLIESAAKEVDRMNTIIAMQDKLDSKGSEFTSIATPIDAKELQELVIKSDKLSKEKEDINIKSRKLNSDLEELSIIEDNLMEEINKILNSQVNENENQNGIYVDSLNSNVYIIDAQLPEEIDNISPELCEIINCNVNLIVEISNLYNSNINRIIVNTEDTYFDELKHKVDKYKTEKNNSYDKQLELLKKSFEEEQVVNTDLNKETENNENLVEEETKEETEPLQTPEEKTVVLEPVSEPESIVPLESVFKEKKDINEDISIIYVDLNDKVVPNQIARATKDKLTNKIIPIFSDSFIKTKIDSIEPKEILSETFTIENFVNNQTA